MLTKNALFNGLFLGIILILASFSFYLANPELFVQTKSNLLFVPFLILLFKTGADARKIEGGYIDFKKLFIDIFTAAAIGTFLCTCFEYILYNIIDPDLQTIMAKLNREILEERDLLDNVWYKMSLEHIENGKFFTVGAFFLSYLIKLLAPCALMSSIFALIMKRKKQLP